MISIGWMSHSLSAVWQLCRVGLAVSLWCFWDQLVQLARLNIGWSQFFFFFFQKSSVKAFSIEQAVKLIQIAERARQGRLRALFMKQIFLQEYRARQARLLGEKVADVAAAALRIQKVCREGGEGFPPQGPGVWQAGDAYQGTVSSETRNSNILPSVQPEEIPERLAFLPWGNHEPSLVLFFKFYYK